MPKIKSESILCDTVSLCCVPQVSVHPKRYSLTRLLNRLPKIIRLFHDFTDNRISNVRRATTQVSIEYVHVHSLVFSLEGRAWQEPEPCHVTGMALAHCILVKYLGVVCHCFPPPLDVPTLAARCLHTQRRERS